MTPADRKKIMKDAHRRYRRRLREAADLLLSWAEALRRAWAAWRHRIMQDHAMHDRRFFVGEGFSTVTR